MNRETGQFQETPEGYRVFIPAPLPPDPPLKMDGALTGILSRADRALGRLDGLGRIVPEPDLFISMFIKKEALLSSRIEGARSTLPDLFEYESGKELSEFPEDLAETVNYIGALRRGMDKARKNDISLELILELHSTLLSRTRGSDRSPGQLRDRQVGIGPPGSNLRTAEFLLPPPRYVRPALENLFAFIESRTDQPPLITCGLFHCQFETIHPFRDGNGRIGRVLIPLILFRKEVLSRPLLYLSHFFLEYRSSYYRGLMNVRERGDWEDWMKFFLRGVAEVSDQAVNKMEEIIALKEKDLGLVRERINRKKAADLLDLFYRHPVLSVKTVSRELEIAFATADSLLREFAGEGLITETTEQKRNRLFSYPAYINILNE